MFGACPSSYSARASGDVGLAPEPSQSDPEYSTQELEEAAQEVERDYEVSMGCKGTNGAPEVGSPPSSPPTPGEAEVMTVEEDLRLSSDSESVSRMSDGGEPASEPPPRDPPSGEGWFDFCEGEVPESSLKRSAPVDDHSGPPIPSPRSKMVKSRVDT